MQKSTKALAFMAGIGAGVAAGVLLAPRSGQETRGKIRAKAMETRESMRQKAHESKERIASQTEKIAETAEQAMDKGRSVAKTAKSKAQDEKSVGGMMPPTDPV